MAGSHVLLDRAEKRTVPGKDLISRPDGPSYPGQVPLLQSTRLLDPRNLADPQDHDTPESVRLQNQQKLEKLREYHQAQVNNGALDREFQHIKGASSLM